MKVDGDGDGDGDNGVRVLNHQQLHSVDKSDIEEGVVSKHQNSVENGVCNGTENVKAQHARIVQVPAPIQVPQQQQSQGTSVCWERFLHLRTLKVLLVENDDSTRHVVAALLRNCSYEVIETSNGMQAWKILEDLANHVDIVLTEVVMPFVSGVGLLCKIMAHKTHKNVPVIMMSSHDSMGLVFKCLSKGAVDFLVKPIRKNELKILWQHVWRRCHSSSGSGSESASGSGTQTQKSVKSKNVEKSGNNASSNDEDDDGSFGFNVGDGSDDGSGTQSSWTKQAVEVESPRPLPPWDQLTECPDSTCAQVIHSNGEISDNKQVPVSKGKEPEEEQQQLENNAFGKDLQIGAPPKPELELKYAAAEDQNKTRPINPVEQGFSGVNEHDNKGLLDIDTANNFQCEVGKPAGVTHNATAPYTDATECKISDAIVKASTDAKGTAPFLEVSLKRVRGSKDVSKSNQEERNVLRRSDSSAFSRYKAAASNTNKASWVGNSQSGPLVVASFDVARKGAFHGLCSHSSNNIRNQRSNVGSNTVDMGSTTNNAFLDSSVSKNKSAVTSMVKHADTPCAVPRKIVSEKAVDELVATTIPAQPAKRDDSASKKKAVTTLPHGGSSNAHGNGPFEGNNACNCSINGSASGSNHGSNHGSNGNNNGSSPAAVHAGVTNMESDNGIAGMSGSAGGDASGSGGGGSGSGDKLDTSRVLQREAALTKFRQKRKERCFRKKVRYQSRKRLADQRPRFRGQFVRKDANESTSGGATDN